MDKKTWSLACGNGGCMFLKAGLTKEEANREATSHQKAYGHNVVMADMAPEKIKKPNPQGKSS